MARISTYGKDLEISDYDAWIGTDSPTRATKQFTAKAVAEYLNIKGKISISAQMVFYYWTANSANTLTPGAGDFYGPSIGTPMTSITTMQVYKSDRSEQNVVAFMNYIVGSHILISKQNDINVFGHFMIDSYTINNPDDNFYTLNLTSVAGNGNLTELLYYDFAIFTPSSMGSDKSFTFTQPTPSVEWTIQHNMDKFPSVSVVNNNNRLMYGNTTYVDKNNLIINFSAGFSGKAYLN
tara:strand:+ start:129 stop:839 length:711 start_codon:yes stop_codon:yes gene_type:complete